MDRLETYFELSSIRTPKERDTLPLWRPSVQRIRLSEEESDLFYDRELKSYKKVPKKKAE